MKSQIWGTQETAVAFLRGKEGKATVYRHKTLAIVGLVRSDPRPIYALWIGKSAKPSVYYSARSAEDAAKRLQEHWKNAEEGLLRRAKGKAEDAEKRAALKASDHWTAGDVIVNSWGYDQTNVDFYQVTKVDAKSIIIRAIGGKAKETGFMSGICQPDRYNYTGEEMRKPLDCLGRISFRHGGSSKWDGKPQGYSNYA